MNTSDSGRCAIDETRQRAICERHGAQFLPPAASSRVGIAIDTLGLLPLNGMRIHPEGEVCGWYLWAGSEPSESDDFYEPMCVEHLAKNCPAAIPFLGLPPGWRFLTDGEYEDVWYDDALIERR